MLKNIAYHFVALIATLSVMISFAVPHHHHGEDTVICLGMDSHAYESDHCCDCCTSEEAASNGACCNLKTNLITHQNESRKENFPCDCGSEKHFHGSHAFLVLAFLVEAFHIPEKLPDEFYKYTPYTNLYHSVITDGHIGLRAPPVA